jgi:signal peptidase I
MSRAFIIGRTLVGASCLVVVMSVLWLMSWATLVAPAWGWSPVTVMSGSMGPSIDAGDVVIAIPPGDEVLPRGAVIMFEHPGRGNVIHRVVGMDSDGSYLTKGDANGSLDSTPVPRDTVKGVGRIVVPAVGTPFVWAEQGQWAYVVAAMTAMLAALWASRWAVLPEFNPWMRTLSATTDTATTDTPGPPTDHELEKKRRPQSAMSGPAPRDAATTEPPSTDAGSDDVGTTGPVHAAATAAAQAPPASVDRGRFSSAAEKERHHDGRRAEATFDSWPVPGWAQPTSPPVAPDVT